MIAAATNYAVKVVLPKLPVKNNPIFKTFFVLGVAAFDAIIFYDPPVPDARLVRTLFHLPNIADISQQVLTSGVFGGSTLASDASPFASINGSIAATWGSLAINEMAASSLTASVGIVMNSNGQTIGSGMAAMLSTLVTPLSFSGSSTYILFGSGSFSFYGPAESALGVSADWDNYTATVSGDVSITVTTDALTLNGVLLPYGTYFITTSAATLSGSGAMSSPTFSGKATVTTTNGTVALGPGSGTITVGGPPLDPADGVTLTGYTGTVAVSDQRRRHRHRLARRQRGERSDRLGRPASHH